MAGLLAVFVVRVTGASGRGFLPPRLSNPANDPDKIHARGLDEVQTMLDFPVAPPIVVKDRPRNRELTTLNQARAYVDEMLHQRRLSTLREIKERLDGAKTEEDAIEAIGSLRELLALEDLTEPEEGS